MLRVATSALVLALVGAAPAAAQIREPRVQLSIGGIWSGASGLGSMDATETRAPASGRYTLFTTESELEAAGGLEARLTYWMTPTVGVEAGGSWSTPRLATRILGDKEDAPNQTVTAAATQYVLDGGVVVRLNRFALMRNRVVPFLFAGAGYLRQLYEDNVLVETGRVYHAGGGAFVWFQPLRNRWLKRIGARADLRWTGHDGGIDLGCDCLRSFGMFSAALAVQF